MIVMTSEETSPALFPPLSRSDVLAFQFSSWYPKFRPVSIKSTIIRPLEKEFHDYLDSDGVFVPEGSEDQQAPSSFSDENEDDAESEHDAHYAFPELDAQIREAIKQYGSVFPKLNFSSPRDASWILPAGSPMKCTSPADIYMLLKSSDFICHDLNEDAVFDGCEPSPSPSRNPYELELVLRKWYAIDPSREMRCFVRRGRLLGICQRDANYYGYLNDPNTSKHILESVHEFWKREVHEKWNQCPDYTFDILLTKDLSRVHIVDFNPYAPRTDSLLFTYEDLQELTGNPDTPQIRVIESRSHPAAARNAPVHQHNMLPLEALQMSNGLDIDTFILKWAEEIKNTLEDD